MIPTRGLFYFLALFTCCILSAAAPWPEIPSDQKPDPAFTYGTLSNGLRYVIRPNTEPRDRITLRLLVAVGSLHERESERGLAHFVEHMVFRGTRSHPGDSLVNALQRLGVGFGPDNTAFTNYDHTIYHLELPDTSEATLRQGLSTFREYASEATFDPDLIERERGVVLSEKATRNTPGYRMNIAELNFLWPDSHHAARPVIGVESTLRSFKQNDFIQFYDAWYRPERMALIIVGQVNPADIEKLLGEIFGPLTPRAPARPEPPDSTLLTATKPDVSIERDTDIIGVILKFAHPKPYPKTEDSHARRVTEMHRSLTFGMFQQRLQRISKNLGETIVAPSATFDWPIPGWLLASFSANGSINNWQKLATAVEQEHRRAFLHGFTQHELDLAKRSWLEGLDSYVRTAPTRRSEEFAAWIAASLLDGRTLVTPVACRQDLIDDLPQTTLDDCLRAFRNTWEKSAPHVQAFTHPDFNISREQLASLLNTSRQQATPARAEVAVPDFAYTHFGPPGKIAAQRHHAPLDIHLAQFTNGVQLSFKHTDFEADNVEIQVRISGGKLPLKPSQEGLDLLGELAFTHGGLGKHGTSELSEILSGRNVSMNFDIRPDRFEFSGQCSRKELALNLQLITAYLTDPAFRPESLREAHASYGSILADNHASPGGPIRNHGMRLILGNDPRFGTPSESVFSNLTLDQLKSWLSPALAAGSIELSIVGDTTWDETCDAVASTLGALPARKAPSPTKKFKKPAFTKIPSAPTVFASSAHLKQSAIAWIFPIPDVNTYPLERRCSLAASVIEEKLRVRIREQLGSTYALDVAFYSEDSMPGCSHFFIYAEVDCTRTEEIVTALRTEFQKLLSDGITDDEFARVKAPYLRERLDDLRTNSYWGHTVLDGAYDNPRRFAAAQDRAADTASINRQEIESLISHYLIPAKGFLFIAEPGRIRNWSQK